MLLSQNQLKEEVNQARLMSVLSLILHWARVQTRDGVFDGAAYSRLWLVTPVVCRYTPIVL